MWWIVVAIIAFILIKFFYDRDRMISRLQRQGGMVEKYKTLLSFLLSDKKAKVAKVTSDSVSVRFNDPPVSIHFFLLQTFRTLDITWAMAVGSNVISKKKWEFPSDANQEQMVDIIQRECKPVLENPVFHQMLASEVETVLSGDSRIDTSEDEAAIKTRLKEIQARSAERARFFKERMQAKDRDNADFGASNDHSDVEKARAARLMEIAKRHAENKGGTV